MPFDATKPNMEQASLAEAYASIRENLVSLSAWNWPPTTIPTAATTGTSVLEDTLFWKITGSEDVSNFTIPGTMALAYVQDGFKILSGGNVANAPLTVWGGQCLLIFNVGGSKYVYSLGYDYDIDFFRELTWTKNSAATTRTLDGTDVVINTTGTLSSVDAADGEFIRALTSAGISASLSVSTNTFNLQRPLFANFAIKTYTSLANVRIWIGLISSMPSFSDTAFNNQNGLGLRFSTGAGDAFWTMVNNNGSAAARVVASNYAPATDTVYHIRLEHDPRPAGGVDRFFINGRLLGVSAGAAQLVRTTSATCGWIVSIDDLATGTPSILWNRTRIVHP